MEIGSLFSIQRELDESIIKKHDLANVDLFTSTILASLGELMECANEWRGFKYWSTDQEPREGLLEEYADKLHFILSLGNQKGFDVELKEFAVEKREDVAEQFIYLTYLTSTFLFFQGIEQYKLILGYFLGLGELLGFTWDQIEKAYLDKNNINHERQKEGY